MTKRLLIIAHAPSENTQALVAQLMKGAEHPDIDTVDCHCQSPFDTTPDDILSSHAVLLFTPENLGYMSGALKDMFDRCYYPCLEETQGLPFAYVIRAGHDGTGTRRAIDTITTGLRWRRVQEPLICRGDFDAEFLIQCEELGLAMAASLDAGII